MSEIGLSYFNSKSFKSLTEALKAGTHLVVGAHPDDLEVMAGSVILECLGDPHKHFIGVIVTDGASSVRAGPYQDFSDSQMVNERAKEQVEAATLGRYAAVLQWQYPSSALKRGWCEEVLQALGHLLSVTPADHIYTHSPMDKHQTHISVFMHCLEALRKTGMRPKTFVGCEVWRGLDWIRDENKVLLPVGDAELVRNLIACHRSQTVGGKAYDQAVLGRLQANATFFEAKALDHHQYVGFGINLLPLLDTKARPSEFVKQFLEDLKSDLIRPFEDFKGAPPWK